MLGALSKADYYETIAGILNWQISNALMIANYNGWIVCRHRDTAHAWKSDPDKKIPTDLPLNTSNTIPIAELLMEIDQYHE